MRWNSQDGPSVQPPPGPGHVTPVNFGVYEVASGLCPCRVVNPWQHISAQVQPLAVCSHTDRQGHWKWVPPRNNPLHGRRQRYCSKTDPRGWWKLVGQKCLGVTARPKKFSNPGDHTGIYANSLHANPHGQAGGSDSGAIHPGDQTARAARKQRTRDPPPARSRPASRPSRQPASQRRHNRGASQGQLQRQTPGNPEANQRQTQRQTSGKPPCGVV